MKKYNTQAFESAAIQTTPQVAKISSVFNMTC
jgi:hypothetical protein